MRLTSYHLLHSAMVAPVGFEPRLLVMGQVSCHCSTSAIFKGGIFFRSEPPRPHMKGNENRISGWYQRWESNSRPLPYEGSALTNWATRAYKLLLYIQSLYPYISSYKNLGYPVLTVGGIWNRHFLGMLTTFGDSKGTWTPDLRRDRPAF